MSAEQLEVLNPVADTVARPFGIAPRPRNLSKKRVALYWNSKQNADVALLRAAQHLTQRVPDLVCELIVSSKPGIKEKVEQAKRYDAVLAASGD